MKKIITSILFASLLLVSGTAFAAKPLEGKQLTMVTDPTFPPFEFVMVNDKGEAELIGFGIDLANKIVNNMGGALNIIKGDFNGLIGSLISGRADFIISSMSPTEERRKSVDFSDPYYFCQNAVLQHKGANIAHAADFKGRKIAATFGTEYVDFAQIAGAAVSAMDYDTVCVQELLAGRVEGVLLDAASAFARQKECNNDDLIVVIIPQNEINELQGASVSESFSVVFPKGSELIPLFNEQIANFMKDGTMKAIYEKWLGPWPYND